MNLMSKIKESIFLKRIIYYCVVCFLFGYIFAIPSFNEKAILNYSIYIFLIALAILISIYFIFFRKFHFYRVVLLLPPFAIYAFFGTVIYSNMFRGWLTLALTILSFIILFYSLIVIDNKKLSINIFIIAIFAFSIYYIIHYRNEILSFASYESESFRLGVYFGNQNDIALYCILGFTLSIYMLLFQRKFVNLLYILPSLSILLVGFTTGSRTFVLSSLLIVSFLLFFRMYHHKLLFFILLALLLALFFSLLNIPFMSTIKERFEKMFETFFSDSFRVDTSTLSRSIWLDYAFDLGGKNIVIGYGYGGFAKYSGVGTYAHSNIAELFADFGLPGLLLFYLPYFAIPYIAIRKRINYVKILISSFVLFFIISFSMVFFYNKLYYAFLAYLFSFAVSQRYKYDKAQYLSGKKNYKNVLIVTNQVCYEHVDVAEMKKAFQKAFLSSNIKTLIFGDDSLIDSDFVSTKTNLLTRAFALMKVIKINKVGTLISIDQDCSTLVKIISCFIPVLKIHILCEESKKTYIFNKNYHSKFTLTVSNCINKNSIKTRFDDSLDISLNKLLERIATYENTFNWK